MTGQGAWGRLTDVAIVRGGESDLLTIEDSRAAEADRRMPTLAIDAFSGGRFPDPERDSFRLFSKE